MMKTRIKIGVALIMWIVDASALLGKTASVVVDTSWALRTKVAGNVFIDTTSPEFTFRDSSPIGVFRYEVKDWLAADVCSGTWEAQAGVPLRLQRLPCGWYTLTLCSEHVEFQNHATFAVVPDPAKRCSVSDSPYAANTVLSWLTMPDPTNTRQPNDPYQCVADLAWLAGLAMGREMTGWAEFSPFPTRQAWSTRYLDNARRLSDHGIPQVVMFRDAPAWTKERETPEAHKLPDNLQALYAFYEKASQGHPHGGIPLFSERS